MYWTLIIAEKFHAVLLIVTHPENKVCMKILCIKPNSFTHASSSRDVWNAETYRTTARHWCIHMMMKLK